MVLTDRKTEIQRKNRWRVLLIFGLSVIPFALAWLLGGKAPFIKQQTNKGQLVTPVITTERSDLIGLDQFSKDNMKELEGHWLLVNLIPVGGCDKVCLDAIQKTRQLQLMMNKDLVRIRRVAIFLQQNPEIVLQKQIEDDKQLLKVTANEALQQKISAINQGKTPVGMLLLMDPLGNIMMQYAPGFNPYDVKSDLSHLLKISQIG